MSYVEFLKTKAISGELRHIYLPHDSVGRVYLPEKGKDPCEECGSLASTLQASECYHTQRCGAKQYKNYNLKGE